MIFSRTPRCQLHSRLSPPSVGQLVRALRSRVRLRTRLRQAFSGKPKKASADPARIGAPSRFAAGTWVRVRDPGEVFATLDAKKRLRGLVWMWQQWAYCGTVHRVFKPIRRMMDDSHMMRAVSGTVLLDTVPCGGPLGHLGCGRECPLMFRDEWLQEVPPPEEEPELHHEERYATVRNADEIRRTLDDSNSYRGLMFMPEMFAYAGQRFPVRRKVERVLDGARYVPPTQPLYILSGLHCTGTAMGDDGPCDRGCRLIWHADWLNLEH